MGIVKIDLLGLGMMAVLEESRALIREHSGVEIDLAHLPPNDPAVYRALQAADTVGMSQVESRAQMACLPRLRLQALPGAHGGRGREAAAQSITSFALYGFPESHAASFALIAYSSAWLKCHHLAAFTAALLNNQPMGFYHPATLVKDAQRHGLRVLPVDVTRSGWKCSIESGAVRLGLCYVKGLRQAAGEAMVAARPFTSTDDLARRVPELRKDELTRLAEVGALNTLARSHRRGALWAAERAARPAGPLLQWDMSPDLSSPLRPMDPFERLDTDYTATGVNLGRHPMAFCRAEMDRRRATPAARLARLRDGLVVRVAGCVIVRQRPGTANGFLFLSLEDETGIANVIVEPAIYNAHRRLFRDHPFLLIEGVLQNQDGVTSVRAGRIEPLSVLAAAGVSHDFR